MSILDKFKRTTSSGYYLPQLDGLRFIAIFMVVALFHVAGDPAPSSAQGPHTTDIYFFNLLFSGGAYGVPVFFIISGFILSLPFAKEKLHNGAPVNLRKYFLRRLTRLEPLYIITLILYSVMRIWIYHYQSLHTLLPRFFASLFYMHNIIYGGFPLINGVTWSLEVEIQFYLLAPLLTYVFIIKNKTIRRGILVALIIAGVLMPVILFGRWGTFLFFSCYFLSGLLLADLYLSNKKSYNGNSYFLLSILLLAGVLLFPNSINHYNMGLIKLTITCGFFFLGLTNDKMKRYLSKRIIAAIGCMCYSIYLLHMGVYGTLRHFLTGLLPSHPLLNIFVCYIIVLAGILIVSAVFFLTIEKPTMKKDWYKNIRNPRYFFKN